MKPEKDREKAGQTSIDNRDALLRFLFILLIAIGMLLLIRYVLL